MSTNTQKTNKGFTLIEVIIVVVIIGIIAGFGLPGYQKSVEKGKARRARVNALSIRVTLDFFESNSGNYPDPAPGTLAAINAQLRLNITDNDFDYSTDTSGTVTVTRTGGSYSYAVDAAAAAAGKPTCASGTCPL